MDDRESVISFLVVVRNEDRHIERCLRSMLDQTLAPSRYEVLVIDGMSTDGTREIVQRIIGEHADRSIRLLDNPERILSSGWNIGIRAARGRFVIRPDAHADVPQDFLERSLAVMEAHPEATAVGGVVDTVGEGFWGKAIAAVLSSRVGVGGSRFRVGGSAGPAETVVFALYRREALLEVGGFDEALVVNQDNVCHARLRQAGAILYFDPSIRSTYRCRSSLGALWRQMFKRAHWLVLMLKHQRRQTFSMRYFVPLGFVTTLAALAIGWGFEPLCGRALFILLAIYALAGVGTALGRRLSAGTVVAFPLVMFVLHAAYGLGSMSGLVRLPFYQPRRGTPIHHHNRLGSGTAR